MRATRKRLTSQSELKALLQLKNPRQLQDYVDTLKPNPRHARHVCSSAAKVLRRGSAHCAEGALVAASWLMLRGHPPYLLDLKTSDDDIGHVVALYKKHGYWGAISKSNHASLRYREPVYANVRELAMSFFHEYFNRKGTKTLRSYSRPFNVSLWDEEWAVGDGNIWHLIEAIDQLPHHPVVTPRQIRHLRLADPIERKAGSLKEHA